MKKITLELFEDCSEYDIDNIDSIFWQMKVDGKEVGKLNTITDIHKALDFVLDI